MTELPEIELEGDVVKSPELQLWASVLHLAILDSEPILKSLPYMTFDQSRYGEVAIAWLSSENMYPGGFRWVCYLLGLDRKRIRRMIGINNERVW